MKTLIIALVISGLIIQQLYGQKDIKSKSLMTGQIYTSGCRLDKVNCKVDAIAKDDNLAFIFLNDSIFISIANNCCPIDTVDFASESYFIGNYKIDNNILTLRYKPNGLTLYIKQKIDNKKDSSPIVSSLIKIEKVDLTLYSLAIKKCKNILYLNNIETDDYICYVSGFGNETVKSIKTRLETKGIWKRLLNL